jgi:RNA polymerase sigma-70 factor, ECF subfamily
MTGPPVHRAQSLVHRAQLGDEEAFRRLYHSVQPGLLRYLRVLVGDQDVDDVASETWLQLVRDLESFRGDDQAFRAWAARVGRNRALDHLRHRQRRPVTPAPVELLDRPGAAGTAHATDAADLAAAAISTDAALALIASLPPDQAEAVLLRVVVGLDARAAGQVLGKRAGAVRTAAHRGLRRLAELLADSWPDPAPEGIPAPGGVPVPEDGPAGVTESARAALKEMR